MTNYQGRPHHTSFIPVTSMQRHLIITTPKPNGQVVDLIRLSKRWYVHNVTLISLSCIVICVSLFETEWNYPHHIRSEEWYEMQMYICFILTYCKFCRGQLNLYMQRSDIYRNKVNTRCAKRVSKISSAILNDVIRSIRWCRIIRIQRGLEGNMYTL